MSWATGTDDILRNQMKNSELKLKNPPIIEAILDIECDLPPNLKIATLESRIKKALGKSYPKLRPIVFQQHQFEAKLNEPPKHSVTGGIQGLQFLHDNENQVVQFRVQGFSFNRLEPYTSLDDYLPQIKKAWLAYVELAGPLEVRLIRLRYINRILLDLVDGRVNLDKYFQNGPKLADEEKQTFLGFLNQYSALDIETGFLVNSVLTAQMVEDDKLPIIFDNSAVIQENRSPDDWTWIHSKILELRQLKNKVFTRTLTETCLNQYR